MPVLALEVEPTPLVQVVDLPVRPRARPAPDDTLRITTKSGATVHALNASEIKAVSLTKLPVANCLTVLTKQEDLQEAAREAKGKPKTHQ